MKVNPHKLRSYYRNKNADTLKPVDELAFFIMEHGMRVSYDGVGDVCRCYWKDADDKTCVCFLGNNPEKDLDHLKRLYEDDA